MQFVKGISIALAIACAGCGAGEDARSRTERARQEADTTALHFLLSAQSAFEARSFNVALSLTDSAASYAPELADVPFLRGRILTEMRQFDLAEEAYQQTLEIDPEYPGVYLNLGNSAYLKGQAADALAFYRKERGAADTAPYLIQLGRAYADLGTRDSARWAFERAIEADSTNPTGYMWLGQLYEDDGDFDQALQYSRAGLALRPDNLNYAYVVGVQHLRRGELERAVSVLTPVTEGMPWHYAAHYNLAQALNGLGRTDDGARYLALADTILTQEKETSRWENLVQANTNEPMLWVNYGNALHRAGRVDDAIEALTIAYSLQPQWLELQNNIANLLLMRGDTTAALARFEALLQYDSTQADVWLNLGTVHALSGQYDAARAAWEAALRQDPEHEEAAAYIAQLP